MFLFEISMWSEQKETTVSIVKAGHPKILCAKILDF